MVGKALFSLKPNRATLNLIFGFLFVYFYLTSSQNPSVFYSVNKETGAHVLPTNAICYVKYNGGANKTFEYAVKNKLKIDKLIIIEKLFLKTRKSFLSLLSFC